MVIELTEDDKRAVEAAMDAFFAYLAQHYRATTGDLSPEREDAFRKAARAAAAEWLLLNDPEPR